MIEKRIKNLWRIAFLITIRQLYFLGRNIYELYYQPYLTIKEIVDKRDKSQIGLMTVMAMAPTILYGVGRIMWDLIKYQRLLMVTGNLFWLTGIVQVIVLAYLSYWILKVINNK